MKEGSPISFKLPKKPNEWTVARDQRRQDNVLRYPDALRGIRKSLFPRDFSKR